MTRLRILAAAVTDGSARPEDVREFASLVNAALDELDEGASRRFLVDGLRIQLEQARAYVKELEGVVL